MARRSKTTEAASTEAVVEETTVAETEAVTDTPITNDVEEVNLPHLNITVGVKTY